MDLKHDDENFEESVQVSILIDDCINGKDFPKEKSWDNSHSFKRYRKNQDKILKGHFSVFHGKDSICTNGKNRIHYT